MFSIKVLVKQIMEHPYNVTTLRDEVHHLFGMPEMCHNKS